ncbi:MAG: hypothetical protein CYG61_03455 [Actinobacteria bacterium]|nr:MAG: hypothetical protein CYG61_03455 [Actinomycetota bacterium]
MVGSSSSRCAFSPWTRADLTVIDEAVVALDPSRTDDAVLAANELATNLLRHSGGRGRVLLWPEDGRCMLELQDGAGGRPPALAGYVRPGFRAEGGGAWPSYAASHPSSRVPTR